MSDKNNLSGLENNAEMPSWLGKLYSPMEETPTSGQENQTPAGDSSSGDISLESVVSINDFYDDEGNYLIEEDVAKSLNSKLAMYGIKVETAVLGGDAIKLISVDDPSRESVSFSYKGLLGSKSKNELSNMVDLINRDLFVIGDKNHLQKVKDRSTDLHNEYVEAIKSSDLTIQEQIDAANKEKLNRFEEFKVSENAGQTPLFDSQEDKDDYEEWRDTGVMPMAREDEMQALDLRRKQNERNEKSDEFAFDLNQRDRDDVFLLEQIRVEELNKKAEAFPVLLKEYETGKAELDGAINVYNNNGIYNQATEDALRKKQQELLINYNSLVKISVEVGNTEIAPRGLDQLSAYYGIGAGMANTAKGLGQGILRGLVTLGNTIAASEYSNNVMLYDDDNDTDRDALYMERLEELESLSDENFLDLAVGLQKEAMMLAERPEFAEINDLKSARRWGAGVMASGLPSMVMSRMGVASMPLYFLSGSGSKSMDQSLEAYERTNRLTRNTKILEDGGYEENGEFIAINEFEANKLKAQNAQDQEFLNIPRDARITSQMLSGAAEVVFEGLFDKMLTDGLFKAIGEIEVEGIKAATGNFIKSAVKNMPAEAGSEGATQFANNVIDMMLLGKDVNLFDGVTDATAGGALMGGVFSATPSLFAFDMAIRDELATRKDKKRLDELQSQIEELTGMGAMDPLNPKQRRKKQDAATEELIQELTDEKEDIVRNISKRLGTDLSIADVKEIGDINRQIRKLKEQATRIALSGKSNTSKAKSQQIIREKLDNLTQQREDLLTDTAKSKAAQKHNAAIKVHENAKTGYVVIGQSMLQAENFRTNYAKFEKQSKLEKQKAYEEAKDQLQQEGKEFDSENVKARARENYRLKSNRRAILQGKKNVENFIKENGLEDQITMSSSETLQESIDWANENIDDPIELQKTLDNINSGDFAGAVFNGKVLVYMPHAAKGNKLGVFAHELLHAVASSKLKGSQKALNAAGEKLFDYLKKNHLDLATYIEAAVMPYIGKPEYYEEMMNALSDALSEGFQYNESLLKSIRRFINTALNGTNLEVGSSGREIFYFIRDYNKKANYGNKTRKYRKFSASTDDKTKFSLSESDLSKQADRAKQVLEKVSANMDFFDPNSPLIARVLPGMIQAQLSKLSNKGLQFDMEEAVSDIILRLYSNQDIAKFDGRGTLYGYINGRISFRIKDMLKASGEGKNDIVEDFNQSDVEDLKGAAANVTTAEQIEERTEAERPEYRNLLERRVVTEETLETIKGKIPRIVGTLKNRIDAPISKNKTVTPLINELRLALGKQIDIDLKKEMGGKKDGQLRKFLVANKKAILENMTTTYLMSAFPIAIQKKVDGIWTSDWQGKKIDRETTSTDMAGRTSGAEMVRRLPKASLKIDDKTFLSFVLEESGNPIRGKKESVAKAIAEELSFDIINEAMQDTDSEIYRALAANQERLGVEQEFNYTQTLRLQAERGNVKFSLTPQQQIDLADAIDMAIVAKYKSDYETYNEIIDALRVQFPDAVEDFELFVDRNVQKSGQFASAFRSLTLSNPEFASLFDMYSKLELNPKKPSFERTAELLHNFNIKLLNRFHPRVARKIGDKKFFGYSKRFIQKGTNQDTDFSSRFGKKKNSARDSSPSKLPLIDKVHFVNSNSEIVKYIYSQKQADLTAEQKNKNIQDKYGERIKELNEANLQLSQYLYGEIFDIASESPELALGAIIFLNAQVINRGPLAELLKIKDYELYDGAETDAIETDAFAYIEKYSADLNAQKKLERKEALVSPKIEHGWPLMRQMIEVVSLMGAAISENSVPSNIAKGAFLFRIASLNKNFNAQLTSRLSSEIMDKRYGRVSPAKDVRIMALPAKNQEALYDAETGEKSIRRVARQIIAEMPKLDFNEKLAVSQALANKASVKFSLSTPQAIFMVGGAGSGKSSVIKNLGLVDQGYRLINQDPYLERYIKEEGLPTDESTYTKEQRSIRAKLGWKARKAAEQDLADNTAAKESMIVDGTGGSYKATTKKMKALEDAGFEIHMIFVNTSKSVASARNAARIERSLPDFVVKKNWDQVQESAQQYRQDYADRFYEINTDNLQYGEALPQSFIDVVNNGLNESKVKFSLSLDQSFNDMIQRQKGVDSKRRYSSVQAKMMGEKKGKYRVFVPSSAEDFRGLTSYTFAGKGRQGEADQKFFEDNLINPYVRGVAQIEAIKQQIRREYHAVAKANKQYFKMLGKKIGNSEFTYDQALRVYMWTQQGIEVPGMTKDDIAFLVNEINQIPGLMKLGLEMQAISRQDTWMEPTVHWMSNTLVSDLNSMTEKVGRKKYLQEFIENSEIIFSKENLNKIEAIYGTRHREALEDALYSMINGRNRPSGANKQMNQWLNWVNNSTGAIMFFNIRSAVLQTLSATNFINWSDNNPVKAAAAFANQPQFWSDFAMIFNSDKLKQRRSGLQTDVNTAEIANQAEGAQNKAGAVIAYLLKVGFTPTQIADSFAIATGGASFYRNRVNTYLKQGMEQEAAEKKAFEDFSKTADEAQQSSDPYLVSQEQRSPLGRLVLAFQNTPMQYTRLMKKSMQDLANGRGDAKTHISKIIYYGAVQNFIFSALQSALFAMIPGFEDEEDESTLSEKELEKRQRKEDTRYLRIINSMTDSVLKGSGVKGAVIATIKNTITEYFKQKEKGWTGDHAYTLLAALSLSPPIGSKARKIYSAIQGEKFDKDVLEARGFSIMADGRVNLSPAYSIMGSLLSGTTNIPMDRMVDIINSIVEATDTRNTAWQRLALALGWKTWDVGAKNEEHDLIIQQAKEKRKEEGKKKAAETRRKKSGVNTGRLFLNNQNK